jgi:hypothetical protein
MPFQYPIERRHRGDIEALIGQQRHDLKGRQAAIHRLITCRHNGGFLDLGQSMLLGRVVCQGSWRLILDNHRVHHARWDWKCVEKSLNVKLKLFFLTPY